MLAEAPGTKGDLFFTTEALSSDNVMRKGCSREREQNAWKLRGRKRMDIQGAKLECVWNLQYPKLSGKPRDWAVHFPFPPLASLLLFIGKRGVSLTKLNKLL